MNSKCEGKDLTYNYYLVRTIQWTKDSLLPIFNYELYFQCEEAFNILVVKLTST